MCAKPRRDDYGRRDDYVSGICGCRRRYRRQQLVENTAERTRHVAITSPRVALILSAVNERARPSRVVAKRAATAMPSGRLAGRSPRYPSELPA